MEESRSVRDTSAMCARYLLGVEDGNQKFCVHQFHPDDITFSKQGKVALVSTLRQGCIDKMYPKVERSRTPCMVGALQGVGRTVSSGSSQIRKYMKAHGSWCHDEDTKFIDLGSGTMMWCLHMALKTGKPVRGRERDRLVMRLANHDSLEARL
jgi:hypothetical protein